ncbi:MAG: PD-(D/E)XK nuclease family protein [Planctomycetota bacterium]|jgi:ATP-dependent helicase/nuclease subunit B
MSVQFILGRSGTGKTSLCIKGIVNALLETDDGHPLILLVPEQASYQAERAILSDKRIAGYNRLHVLSFDRLQFLLSGKHTTGPALSRIGRQMIVHRILRDNLSKLKVFGSSATWPGLGRQMAKIITELHQYAKTPDDIDRLLSELAKDEHNNLAALKFADIGLILKEYLEFIEGRFIDPDIQLSHACRAVAEAAFVKGAKLWVDGFARFTAAELAILAEMLKVVANIDLANPDIAKLDPAGIFGPTERTYTALIETIRKCKLQLAEPMILDEAVRFSSCRPLAHIERNVFDLKPAKIPASDNVRIISAPNARAEVRFVARQILELVREKGYRYRDIAVIASDIDRYEHYIRAYFDDYDVPFFIDKRKSLNQHPAVQLLSSALQVVTGGFSHGDIFTYLKTDLVPIERSDVDVLENYCLAFGISQSDWTGGQEWNFAANVEYDQVQINEIRLKVVGPLLELRENLCPADNPAKKTSADVFVRAIYDFLNTLGVRETIKGWIEEAVERKEYANVDEHLFNKLMDILDTLVEVFEGQEMGCQDYVAILDSAFSQLTLAFIPPTLDQVLVGSIERSRHPDLKAVFLIGATQRRFPVPVSSAGILTDEDRSAAESADFMLSSTASQELAERQYLAYIAFTRPSEFLCVTYPVTDDKGSGVPRSQFIDNLESLFENLSEESIAGEQIAIEKVHNKTELADLLCSGLGKDTVRNSMEGSREQFSELLEGMCADEELAELGSNVLSAINYDNRAQLDENVVAELFGERIRSSATRLSTFAACPYQYFARYVLELKEREEFKLEPLDLGNFYHRVLDALLKKLCDENKDYATVEDKELLRLLNEQISNFIQTDAFISHFSQHSAHNMYIINSATDVLEDCILAIAQMVRAGSFRPALSEVSFGQVRDTQDTLGKYEIALPDKRLLSLNGKIDRLDIAELDGKKVAAVFDYKRRGMSFSWSKFYYGLDMQLPIYMLAVRNAAGSKTKNAAGAFYMPVETVIGQTALDELPAKGEKFEYKAKGILNGEFFQQLDTSASSGWGKFYNFRISAKDGQYGDYARSGALRPNDFEKVLEYTEKKIVELATEFLSGKIQVSPYRLGTMSPCGYCRYKPVCRFDWQINDYNSLEPLSKLQVLEKMSREGRGK